MSDNWTIISYFLWVFCPLSSILIPDLVVTTSIQIGFLVGYLLLSSIEEHPKSQLRLSAPMLFTLGWSAFAFAFAFLSLRCVHILLTTTWTFLQSLAVDFPLVFWFGVFVTCLFLVALTGAIFVIAVSDTQIDTRLFNSLLLPVLVLMFGLIAFAASLWLPDEFSSLVTSYLVSPLLGSEKSNSISSVVRRSEIHPLVVSLDFVYKVVTLLAYAVAAYTVIRRCFLPVVQTYREFRFGSVVRPVSDRSRSLTHSHWYGRVGIQRPDPVADHGPSVVR
jgi:hypothetical protein